MATEIVLIIMLILLMVGLNSYFTKKAGGKTNEKS